MLDKVFWYLGGFYFLFFFFLLFLVFGQGNVVVKENRGGKEMEMRFHVGV